MFELVDFSFNDSLKDQDFSNAKHSATLPRHRWYPIKEAFSPQFVKKVISDESQERRIEFVFDPFCGSGTVPLCASFSRTSSLGFEVNPFLAFIAHAKSVSCTEQELLEFAMDLVNAARVGSDSPLLEFSTFTEYSGLKKWLFNSEVIRSFEGAYSFCDKLPEHISLIYRLILIYAAMQNCNARRDGKCLRYRKDWKTKGFNSFTFIDSVKSHLSLIIHDLGLQKSHSDLDIQPRIIEGDCRKLISKVVGHIDLCITSPPYLNSFDYSDVYRPELFLGKFVSNNDELMKIRLKTLRSHVQASWEQPSRNDFGQNYDSCFERINSLQKDLWDARIPSMIQAYFEDMLNLLMDLRCISSLDTKAWIVVSTSAYVGVEIPVDLIIAEIASRTGWTVCEIYKLRQLRAASHHFSTLEKEMISAHPLRESAVVLKAA